jgi:hypothetical protein
MMRATFTAAVAFFCVAATVPPVTFESPCECRDNHGKHRWSVKIDPSPPPADANAIQAVTPSDIYSWPGPDVPLTQSSERTGIENKWFALTGRVVALKVESDVIYTLRFKMPPETSRGLLSVKCQRNCNGVRFVTRFLVGRVRDSLFNTSPGKKLALNQTFVPSRG